MTSERLAQCLNITRWTPDTLARALECDVALVDAWLQGEQEIPMKVGAWVQTLASLHQSAEDKKPSSIEDKPAKP
jgi:hypothetical protein